MKTTATTAISDPVVVSLVVPAGVQRLARQQHTDPDVLIHQLLKLATREVDYNLAVECGTFATNCDDFDVTEAMDMLTTEQIKSLEDYSDTVQRVIYWHATKQRGETPNGNAPSIPAPIALRICREAGILPLAEEVSDPVGDLAGC